MINQSENKFDLGSCLAFVTTRSSKLFSEKFDQMIRSTGLSQTAWIAMYYINEESKINQHKLAERLGIAGPSVVKLIQKLTNMEYVVSILNPQDRRERFLQLTKSGYQAYSDILPKVENYRDQITNGIDPDSLKKVSEALEIMQKNAQEM